MTKRSTGTALLATAMLGLALGAAAWADHHEGAGEMSDHSGDVTLTYAHISALTETGQPDPARDSDCQADYGDWVGREVMTHYEINPQTLMMHASSTVDGTEVDLFPLGIQGIYAFMSDGVPPALEEENVFRVLFEISTEFEDAESRLMTTLDETTNCLIES